MNKYETNMDIAWIQTFFLIIEIEQQITVAIFRRNIFHEYEMIKELAI